MLDLVPDDLTYTNDEMPGIRRRKSGKAFRYVRDDAKPVREAATLARIKRLAVPPAWTDVWICALPNGHLQATGRDARGRKQYRYHSRWRQVRDEAKYERTLAFGEALPALRARVAEDMARPGLSRERVLATVVRLLETTLIRVGNEEYRRANHSIGLTTMRDRHVSIEGAELRFEFRGKSGKGHLVTLRDRRLAAAVRRCRDVRGYPLFQYLDADGERRQITSSDVNAYLNEVMGADFTAKDFRTWAGTVLATAALREVASFDTPAEAQRNLVRAVESVARRLGNTPAICRKCYIHPDVVDAYLSGELCNLVRQQAGGEGLEPGEAAVLALLRPRLKASSGVAAAPKETRHRARERNTRRAAAARSQS